MALPGDSGRAMPGTHRGWLYPVCSLRLREGCVEFQVAHRVAREYGPFNRDKNQMFRTTCCVGISTWSVVGPFSGLMRKAILKQLKAEAELQAKG